MIMADDNLGTSNLFSGNFESQYKDEIDELFTKIKAGDSSDQAVREYTDEQRIASVMKFFNQLQFQTILVAPSPKIQDIEENFDSVLTVMREDTTSFVEDFRYYGE